MTNLLRKKKVRFLTAFMSVIFMIGFSATAYALSLDDLQIRRVPGNGDSISGVAESIHLIPFGQTLEAPYEVSFSKEKVSIPGSGLYKDHLGIFHWNSGFGFENQYIDSIESGEIIKASVSNTGIYFLQPIVPEDDLVLTMSKDDLNLGSKVTIKSQQLVSNSGEMLWDGFPFWVSLKGGEVVGETFDDGQQAYLVEASGGSLSFEIKALLPGELQLFVSTDFGSAASTGSLAIAVDDTSSVVSPPTSIRIEEGNLVWDLSNDTDIGRYVMSYRESGQLNWNGVDIKELPSPVSLSPESNSYSLQFQAYSEGVAYEIGLQAVDLVGNESAMSNLVSYSVPLADFSVIQSYIRNEAKRLEELKEQEKASVFPDLTDHWSREDVEYLAQLGVVGGYEDGSFGPDNQVTRAQFVKMVLIAFNIEVKEAGVNSSFNDVAQDAWFVPYIETAREKGILNGYPDRTFRPYGEMNRAEGLKVLLNAASVSVGSSPRAEYEDVDYKQWYVPYVNTATEKGIIAGVPALRDGKEVKYFDPIRPMKRSELATVLVRMVRR